MTRARHVTPCHTACRIEKICSLVLAFQARGAMTRAEIGDVLKMGPSGVRKYLVDLGEKVAFGSIGGEQLCRLTLGAEEARAFVAQLAREAAGRPRPINVSDFEKAKRDPNRHFHILDDDEHYAIRLGRAPIVRDPLVAAFFGPHGAGMGVHA
jgi:hypothetical protein